MRGAVRSIGPGVLMICSAIPGAKPGWRPLWAAQACSQRCTMGPLEEIQPALMHSARIAARYRPAGVR